MDKMIFYIFKAQGISPEVIHLVRTLIFRKTNIFYSQIRTPRSVVPSCPINFSPHILMNVGSGRQRAELSCGYLLTTKECGEYIPAQSQQ